jgi:hypothetical protein
MAGLPMGGGTANPTGAPQACVFACSYGLLNRAGRGSPSELQHFPNSKRTVTFQADTPSLPEHVMRVPPEHIVRVPAHGSQAPSMSADAPLYQQHPSWVPAPNQQHPPW